MIHLLNQIDARSGWRIGLLLFVTIGWVDYVTGYQVSLVGFYFLAVVFISWFSGRKASVLASFIGALLWWGIDHFSEHVYPSPYFGIWNAFMRLILFLVGGLACSQLRQTLNEKQVLIEELKAALEQIETLTGILPSCSCCRRVRNGDGHWDSLETYVRDKTHIEFLESICPDCALKDLPFDVVKKSGE